MPERPRCRRDGGSPSLALTRSNSIGRRFEERKLDPKWVDISDPKFVLGFRPGCFRVLVNINIYIYTVYIISIV